MGQALIRPEFLSAVNEKQISAASITAVEELRAKTVTTVIHVGEDRYVHLGSFLSLKDTLGRWFWTACNSNVLIDIKTSEGNWAYTLEEYLLNAS